MSDDFQPSTPFEGFVFANLQNIKEAMKELPCKESSKRITEVEKKVANIEGKATLFGAIMGFVGGILSKNIWGK